MFGNIQSRPGIQSEFRKVQGSAIGARIFRDKNYKVILVNFLTMILWIRNFLEARGYGVSNHILCPDNNGAILLEKNGRKYVGKHSRHLEIRYFL